MFTKLFNKLFNKSPKGSVEVVTVEPKDLLTNPHITIIQPTSNVISSPEEVIRKVDVKKEKEIKSKTLNKASAKKKSLAKSKTKTKK